MTTKTTYPSIGYRSHSKSILDSFVVHIIIGIFVLFYVTNNFYRVGGIPWPLLIFLPLTLALARREVLKWAMFVCFRRPTLGIVIIFVSHHFLTASMGVGYFTKLFYAVFSLMLLLGCALYVFRHPQRLFLIVGFVILILNVSAILYLLQFLDFPLAYTIRDNYWAGTLENTFIERGDSTQLNPTLNPTGLASVAAAIGYQLAGLIPIAFTLVFSVRHVGSRLLLSALLLVSIAVLFFSHQRSAFLGVGIATIFILYHFRQSRTVVITQIVLGLLVLTVLTPTYDAFVDLNRQLTGKSTLYVYDKFRNTEEINPRLELQVQALKLLIEYPFGLGVVGKTWYDVADLSAFERPIYVHNGFLGIAVDLGIFSFLWMVYIVVFMMRRFIRGLQNMPLTHSSYYRWRLGLLASLIALIINTLFHNASLFGLERTSTSIYAILVVWSALESKYPNLYSELIPADASPKR